MQARLTSSAHLASTRVLRLRKDQGARRARGGRLHFVPPRGARAQGRARRRRRRPRRQRRGRLRRLAARPRRFRGRSEFKAEDGRPRRGQPPSRRRRRGSRARGAAGDAGHARPTARSTAELNDSGATRGRRPRRHRRARQQALRDQHPAGAALREGGLPGEDGEIELRLRLLADVGLVGLPNAGKSSLLARMTPPRRRSPTTRSRRSSRCSARSTPTTASSCWSTSRD